jgi:hypothetical protein
LVYGFLVLIKFSLPASFLLRGSSFGGGDGGGGSGGSGFGGACLENNLYPEFRLAFIVKVLDLVQGSRHRVWDFLGFRV